MRATTRSFTPTIVGLLSIIALLLAVLVAVTPAVATDGEPEGDAEECVGAATVDEAAEDDCDGDEDVAQEEGDEDLDFTDLPEGLPHIDGISWLAEEGLTNGCAAGRFCPNKPLKRGEFASFLYRYHNEHADGEPTVEELHAMILKLTERVDALEGPQE